MWIPRLRYVILFPLCIAKSVLILKWDMFYCSTVTWKNSEVMNIKKIVYVESVKNMFLKVWIMWNVKQFYWSRFSYVSIPAEWNWKLPYSFLVAFWVLGGWGSVFPTPVRFCSSSQNWFSGAYLSGLMCGIQEYGCEASHSCS